MPLISFIFASIACAALYRLGRLPPVIVYWYCPFDARPPMLMVGVFTTYVAMPGTWRNAAPSTGTSSSAESLRSLRGASLRVMRPVFTVAELPPYPLAIA